MIGVCCRDIYPLQKTSLFDLPYIAGGGRGGEEASVLISFNRIHATVQYRMQGMLFFAARLIWAGQFLVCVLFVHAV